jgi:AcrR family transcriptional regulator
MTARDSAARAREVPSTRDAILDAAERRFAARGFAGVSVRQITADAGLRNQASLYHHFKNKQAIYEAVLARGIAPIVAIVTGDQTGPHPVGPLTREALEDTLDRICDYLAEHPHLPRLIERAGLDDSRYLRGAVTRHLAPLYALGVQTLALAGTRWSADELPHLAAGLYHLIFGYFANHELLAMVTKDDPLAPAAVAGQRRFMKAAVAELLGFGAARET